MESVKTPTMHVTDTKIICPTLPDACNGGDAISKKLEDELLYGTTEDVDEEDAQSDDSLRLRLSDDEDGDDNGSSLPVNNQLNKSEKTEPLANEKDASSSGTDDIQHEIRNDNKSIISENENCQSPANISGPSLKSSGESSPTCLTQNESNKDEVIHDDNDTVTITKKVNCINDSKRKDTNEKLVDEPNVKQINVPISTKIKVQDVSETPITKNNGCQQSTVNNSENHNIKEIELATPQTESITSNNLPKNDIVIKTERTVLDVDDSSANMENVSTVIDDSNSVDNSEKVPDKTSTIDGKPDDSDSENRRSASETQANDGDDKSGIKRSRGDYDDENSEIKKKQTRESTINGASLMNNGEIKQLKVVGVSANTGDDLKTIVTHKIITRKSGNESGKSNNENINSETKEEKSVLSIDILDEDESLDRDDDKLEITAIIQSTDSSVNSKSRRRKRKTNPAGDVNSGQEKENVRQKRETAQKAEEIIRKRFLNNDSDSDSSDNVSAAVNQKVSNLRTRLSSPSSLKRICTNESIENSVKKPKKDTEEKPLRTYESMKSSNNHKTLEQVRKFFWKDEKKSLSKFTQEQLEEILIQKIIETITMRDEIGRLREQAKISERNQEATRFKCQQLTKQIKDFEMVLTRFSADRRTGDKNAPPIKINRSVGLQVNFLTDQGVQNLRQLQQNTKPNVTIVNGGNPPNKPPTEATNNNPNNNRKGIKVRSPRRTSDVPPVSPTVSTALATKIQSPITTTISPIVPTISKSVENPPVVNTVSHVIPPQNSITLISGTLTSIPRATKVLNTRANINNENLIDLTGEEDKIKNIAKLPPLSAISSVSTSATIIPKGPPRYQRVIQSTQPNVTIAQSAIKLVQPVEKPLPTALVNNMNAPRLTFVMHGITGQRQLVIPSNSNTIRPAVSTNNVNNRAQFPITYAGVQTIANGTVRVLPTTTVQAQKLRHPAPLPGIMTYPVNNAIKLPPPAPALKISRVSNGIVLSWNMKITSEYAEIASYQLYAYQEIVGMAPSTSLWKKVGDVRALPLPMACTLTQFSEGNNYYFAVRAVDAHSRFGQYSQPGNISL